MPFNDFPLNPTLLANIAAMGFQEPSDIQAAILPLALAGGDVSGLSRTGTGKTAAFLIPTIHRMSELPEGSLALCLAPTRELAQQIQVEANKLAKDMNLPTVSVVGGMSSEDQIRALQNGARIITGTPGRLIDLFKERALDLSRVEILVFDEADRMFDMGFVKDMQYLLEKINQKRQILVFSATMNFTVLNMLYEFGANPQEVNVSRDQMTADKIDQLIYHVGENEKPAALVAVINKHNKDGSMIIFVNYKERVPWVAELLRLNGIPAEGLSSLMRQEKRNKIIQGFKQGKYRALVATDVASRGLDIDDVALVVNYHLPEEAATYVHRIGRTARAGKSGIAVSIPSGEDAMNQVRIEEFLSAKIPTDWLNEEDMPKDLKFPNRNFDGREDEEDAAPAPHGQRNDRGHSRDRGPRRDHREARPPREPREPREARPPRAPHPAATDGAPVNAAPNEPRHRNERHPRGNHPRDRDNNRPRRDHRGPREPFVAPADMPSPLTGNPIIYCMKTGKPKNRSDAEMQELESAHSARFKASKPGKRKAAGPAIIKKISSKVTALFGAKKE